MPLRNLIIIAIISISPICANASKGILNLSETITDTAIVYPESFETDVHRMMQNWYLQNYIMLDTKADSESDVAATDDVLIQRLSQIPTTIEMPFNQIVKSHINMYTQRRRGLVENMLGMSLYYMPIFEEALEREGLPLELRYLPVIESALNPDAVSRAGATGLWQFMLPTARGFGMEINTLVDERRDPLTSSQVAAKYLKQLYEIYGDWSLAIAAYNCGPGNVNKALRRAGIDPENPISTTNQKDFWAIYYNLPTETRGYVPAFIAANYVMTYYKYHNISPALARRPILTDTIHVNRRVHFDQISAVLDIPVDELRALNPQYRQDIIPGDLKPYTLRLPSKLVYAYIMSEDSILNYNQAKYERRTMVEPTAQTSAVTSTRMVVKTHKVGRGETMTKIASRYGVSVADIKKWNNLRTTKVKRGQRLKIHTYETVTSYAAPKETTPDVEKTEPTDSIATTDDATPIDVAAEADTIKTTPEKNTAEVKSKSSRNAKAESQSESRSKKQSNSKKATTGKTTTHTVKAGESYWKIAKKYPGVTADDIRKANPKIGDKIQAGQKLVIPHK